MRDGERDVRSVMLSDVGVKAMISAMSFQMGQKCVQREREQLNTSEHKQL